MADESRPQGRGRSRARGANPPTRQPPTIVPPQGAWARRPGSSEQPDQQSAYGPPPGAGRSVRPATPQGGPHGDRPPGVSRSDPQPSSSAVMPIGGSGDAASAQQSVGTGGRGAMRGRRIINSDSLMTRPPQMANSKSGTTGSKIKLKANYFPLVSAPDWCLFQYRVDFSDEEDQIIVRKGLLRNHREALGSYLFDGTLLYTCARLPNVTQDNVMELSSVRVADQRVIVITIRLVGDLVKGDPHYVQLYNIIMRRGLEHLNLQLVGRNYFDARARLSIPQYHFELWPGYMTTIRQHERSVLMGVEVTHKVMRQETILQIMNNIRANGPRDVQAECKRELIGLTVLTDYNNRTYRVDDIDFAVNPQTTFDDKKKGGPNSYMNYYQERYGITIRNATQPLLRSRSTVRDRRAGNNEQVFLVPELCRATGLTDSMKTDFRLMKAMAEHTRVTPRTRIEKLLAFNSRLTNEPNVIREFTQWELKLGKQLIEVPGRVLPQEKILFNRRDRFSGERADWSNAFRDHGLIVSAKLTDWFVIVPDRLAQEARNFVGNLIRAGQGMSFSIGMPQYITMRNDSAVTYTQHLDDLMSRHNPQLVFCVAMRPRADVYSAIKKKCCVDRPVPSQVLLAKQFNPKGMMSIATKVAIQLNCKIGGAPWSINVPIAGLMVVGFDVCHDPKQRGTDIGAMVASLDRGLGRYFSAISRHSTNEELSNDFGVNMIKAVRKYHEMNRAFPERIIIYRDGVGDGQISFVVEHEVMTIRKALAEFYGSPEKVRLAFVLVTKRINTRLFYNEDNPPPGTVVDDVITNPNRYDFFIVAQHVGQGSVSPTAYNVIDDNTGIDVNTMQSLAFKLTHMYFNWAGTVRVPAPCQYAHKLAFLVSQSIHNKPSSHLETLLYFL